MSEPHVTLRSLRSRGKALPLLAGALRGNAAARDTLHTEPASVIGVLDGLVDNVLIPARRRSDGSEKPARS